MSDALEPKRDRVRELLADLAGAYEWFVEPRLATFRRFAHATARILGWWAMSGCVAFVVLTLLATSVAGFELDHIARLFGGFWTHFADATPAQRRPVEVAMVWAFAVTLGLVAWMRSPIGRPKSKEQKLDQ